MDAATGHQGERPPDPVVVIEMSHIEDRPSLHVSPESQPTQKRGHAMEVPLHEADDMDVVIMDDGVGGGASPSTMLTCSEGLAPVMSSFKEKLMGPTRVMRDMQYISELDVEVPEEDATSSRFVLLDDDNVAEEEGIVSATEGVPASSDTTKTVAHESNSSVMMGSDLMSVNRASRLKKFTVQAKEDGRRGIRGLLRRGHMNHINWCRLKGQ
ncbi:hypothetical protein V6N12_048580 [Hibiscus sabdariffa]|uniref:Uncharacterized protein n=1 Tax=Hibiscus sabdariffa TaxID=183260 RepID=A0ABR2EK15_9ROSI